MREYLAQANSKLPRVSRAAVRQVITALFGFLAARTALLGEYAPFGVAVAAGVPLIYSAAAALGAAVGYFLPVTGGSGFRYLAAVVCIGMIKFLIPRSFKGGRSPAFCACVALATGCVTSAVVLASGHTDWQTLLSLAVECFASAGAAYFVATAYAVDFSNGIRSLSPNETVSFIFLLGILLMAFSGVSFAGVTAAQILGCAIVMASARCGGEKGGALAGASLGFFVSLTDSDRLWLAGAYALGGLLAGVFTALGDIGCAVVFNATLAVFVLLNASTASLPVLYASLCASLIFLLLPRKWKTPVAALFAPQPEMPRLDGLRKAVTMRLQFASEALGDISETVETVAQRLSQIQTPDFEQLMHRVEADACARCSLRKYCWEDSRETIVAELAAMTKGSISPEAAGEELKKVCSHLDALCGSLALHYGELVAHRAAQRRVDEVRGVLIDQFSGISDMLYDMACELETARRYDFEAARRVESVLRRLDIIPTDIGCCIDRTQRMTVEIRVQAGKPARFNRMTLMKEISLACDRDFDPPCIHFAHDCALITLSERAEFAVDIGVFSLSMNDAKLCGDATEQFTDGRGRQILILCDGMGTGGRAAVDSAMAAGLMERLLKSGFGYDCALKIANSAMRFKSTDESLSTVDLCAIDLYTGRAELYKAGACPTVVLRSGRTAKAECTSLPAGIVREIGFDSAAVMLKAGDMVVMFSDGATSEGVDWICAEVEAWHGSGTAQQLAEHLARSARRRRSDGHDDDITVMVSVMEKAVK